MSNQDLPRMMDRECTLEELQQIQQIREEMAANAYGVSGIFQIVLPRNGGFVGSHVVILGRWLFSLSTFSIGLPVLMRLKKGGL